MGVFNSIANIFGLGKDKGQGQAPQRANRTTLLQDKRGLDLFNRIKARSQGQGLGIAQKELDPASATFATRQRRAFNESTMPMISQQASSRGLGKSTIPINRAALEKQKTEESISERIANIQLQNELLKRQEQSTAIGREGAMVGTDVNQQNAETQAANMFQQAEFLRQQGYRERSEAKKQEGLKLLVGAAAPVVGGALSAVAPALAGIPGVGGVLSAGAEGLGQFSTNVGNILNPPKSSGLTINTGDNTSAAQVQISDDEINAMGLSDEDTAFLKTLRDNFGGK